ncbi:MAG: CTP synthase (glutamine hydrolyzing) [archaeon]
MKFIFVTGGVLSGIGKGIATASMGKLLADNYRVLPIKCDGYLNVDPGTMNPTEHGEVFVLDDGGEVDMDFGHYERFLNIACKFDWNLTMGKVYEQVRIKERRGDYLGRTVQLIPHVTNTIKDWWKGLAEREQADIVLIEIGGTVGDIENELYIEAARQLHQERKQDTLFAHLSYIPIPGGVKEQKTKPTQQSAAMLRERGIIPDIIIARCCEELTEQAKERIALFCNLDKKDIISDIDNNNVAILPLSFHEQGLTSILESKLGLKLKPDFEQWKKLLNNFDHPDKNITIAICGKYTRLEDSYASINEALKHCRAHFGTNIKVKWIDTTNLNDAEPALQGIDAVIVPGGFGSRGTEGKIKVIEHCRTQGIPFLGICFGMQLAVIEFARNICNLVSANSTEINPDTLYPVIDILPEQKTVTLKGGTMRLGSYPALLKQGSLAYSLYGTTSARERHRHRYEVNPDYHKLLEEHGLVFSGMSPDGRLAEFVELPSHPYYIGTQGHPELKSSLLHPAPLFYGLVRAALKKQI